MAGDTRRRITDQVGTAMPARSNQIPQTVLALIRQAGSRGRGGGPSTGRRRSTFDEWGE